MRRRAERRDEYAQVGRAIRRGGEMLIDGDLSRGAFRAWAVVVGEVASWSRLSETVSRSDLAQAAQRDPKVISAAMAEMHSALVLTWEPGRRNVPSRVTIHPTFEHLQRYRTRRGLGESPQAILAALRSGDSEDPGVNTDPPEPEAKEPEATAGSSGDYSGEVSGSQRGPRGHHPYEENEENEERESASDLGEPWSPLMATDTPANRIEFAQVFASLEAEHGSTVSAAITASLVERCATFKWSSEYRKAARRATASIQSANRAHVGECDRCGGTGVYESEHVPGAYERCDHQRPDEYRAGDDDQDPMRRTA